jgi:hippurate hydrolase
VSSLATWRALVPAARLPELTALREDLHRHPELSLAEHRTAARLERALLDLGIEDVRRVATTGVVARIRGEDPEGSPPVAIRGDIDALPIREDTGLPFSSQVDGVMHACGHDVHATWVVAAAALLLEKPCAGDVVLVLQPAEELGTGAQRILDSGCLEGVAAIFGAHVDRRYEVGQVVVQEGPMAAATDEFVVRILGAGGHGARPHLTRDPIVAAAAMVQALQTVVARRIDPGEPAVVTVGSIHGGTAANVIPERVELQGTLRSCAPRVRAALSEATVQLCRDVATAFGVQAEVEIRGGTPPIVNPPEATAWARSATVRVLGEHALTDMPEVNMGGEDFAVYLEHLPGCFLRVGAREPGGAVIGAHTPRFYAAEEAIWVGAAVLAETAREASRALRRVSVPTR